jgi:hypothetical protein
MKSLAELDHLDLDPTAKTQVAALLQSLLDQTARDAALLQAKDALIKAKDFKIEALTHEVAYYRRLRFSVKSEALSPLQRDVFEESWNTDVSAIEAELEQLQDNEPGETVVKPKRPRAGRKMLLHFLHSPHPCGLSTTLAGAFAAYRTPS